MSITGNIRKILFVTLWSVVGAGALVLLIAAINRRNSKACKGYKIEISGAGGHLFIDKHTVVNILTDSGDEKLTGKSIGSFNLRQMEHDIAENPWVKNAEVFFDNNDMLRVNITEREPVARIFTTGGNTFYMDSSGTQLPLSEKVSVKIPVFTSYPSEKIKSKGADSALLQQVKTLSAFIAADSFWKAQIAQVDITPAKTFEMIPVIGNHLIVFGDGNDYQHKFRRLFIFYKEVLAKTGFDRYARIDVSYEGEVIGTKKGSGVTKSDSLLAIKNIRQLIRSAQQLQSDTAKDQLAVALDQDKRPVVINRDEPRGDSVEHITKPIRHADPGKPDTRVVTATRAKPVKPPVEPVKKPAVVPSTHPVNQKPKAVMPANH